MLHLVLLAMWRWVILPDLARAPHAEAAVGMIDALPVAPRSWSTTHLCAVTLKLPPLRSAAAALPWPHPPKTGLCTAPMDGGWLHVHSAPLDESYWEAMALFAPHPQDVALWNRPWHNGRTIVAVAWRATRGPGAGVARRFATATARGAIVTFANRGVVRHVIYAYKARRCGVRMVTVTRASERAVQRVLATLDPCPPER
jgi:hypothetical protein